MTDAVMMPPRTLPISSTSTKMTISAPSIRFCAIVPVVRAIRLLRSRNGTMRTSAGRLFCTSSIRSFTAVTTLSLLAPFSISIMPPTAS